MMNPSENKKSPVEITGNLHLRQNPNYIGRKLTNQLDSNHFDEKLDLNNSSSSSVKLQERYVWEIRKRSPNTTPASTVLNSPELLTDVNYSTQLHQQIRVGRSPVSMHDTNESLTNELTSPGSPTDLGSAGINLVHEGEIVVFDDIDTNWIMKTDKAVSNAQQNDDILKVTKMIGQLPIAEYEGSPRRIGNYQHDLSSSHFNNTNRTASSGLSPSLFPRPPGFPQRISPSVTQELNSKQQQQKQIENLIDIENEQMNATISDEKKITSNDYDANSKPKTPTFDYLYEFSETRKVLEEFFKGTNTDEIVKKFSDFTESDDLGSTVSYLMIDKTPNQLASFIHALSMYIVSEAIFHETNAVVAQYQIVQNFLRKNQSDTNQEFNRSDEKKAEHAYIGQRLARIPNDEFMVHRSPKKVVCNNYSDNNDMELYSNSRSSGGGNDLIDAELETNLRRHSRNFTLSPETTDYDSNCGDLDSLSNDLNCQTDFGKLYTSMPVLEDGLSSGHASDTENNLSSVVIEKNYLEVTPEENNDKNLIHSNNSSEINNSNTQTNTTTTITNIFELTNNRDSNNSSSNNNNSNNDLNSKQIKENNFDLMYPTNLTQTTPLPPPALTQHRPPMTSDSCDSQDIQEAIKDIRSALQRTKALQEKSTVSSAKYCDEVVQGGHESPIWVPRCNSVNENIVETNKKEHEDDEADTDLETDRLLGQQRLDDQGFYDENSWKTHIARLNSPSSQATSNNALSSTGKLNKFNSATIRHGIGTELTPTSNSDNCRIIGTSDVTITSPEKLQYTKVSPTGSVKSKKDSTIGDNKKSKPRNKEELLDPAVLIEGVLFRARYLGSTQLVCEGQPTKSTRMMQAEEAVSRIKAPDGESQPSTEVDLFISTEKIMVLNTDLKEIMMDHALRTISYIADIGDLVVLMARRRFIPPDTTEENVKPNRTPKMICHVFESDEAQFIAQSIGQAFQVAYMEFLKANGIEDHSFVKEMDYQEVLNSQEIFGDELEIFAKKELQKEVVVPKAKGEILGVVIVESGWGSMLPTVVIANLMSTGAAARCGQLNIGDQLIAINGMSLVGLPLSNCQTYIRNAKNQTAVKFTVVPCPPVVEVKIKRPNTKYQLGFSVQNGVICSLLRGGIAERGGVRVGHRIIEINNQSVVAVPHEKIVNLLATSVGEILMKTMPTSMFRLLTGQENPIYI